MENNMTEYTPLSGIYTALVTPFHDDESLDPDGLSRIIDDQLVAGVAGVVVNGSTGEFPALSAAEREQTVETAIEAVGDRAPVIVGLGSVRTAESVHYAEHALNAGAACGLLVMPYYEPLSDDELRSFVADVAAVGLPIMIYNNPGGTGNSLEPEFIATLAEIDNVVAVKDTTPEPRRLFAIDRLAGGRLDVLSGHDTTTVFAFLSGRQAAVWGAPNAHPRGCVGLWELAVRDRDFDGALELWQSLYPLNAFLESHNYMASTKAGANIRGVNVGQPRLPIKPLGLDATAELEQLIHEVDAAAARLAPAPTH
jgi:4-hydroxy-tetrahydrodipicolinate synthase